MSRRKGATKLPLQPTDKAEKRTLIFTEQRRVFSHPSTVPAQTTNRTSTKKWSDLVALYWKNMPEIPTNQSLEKNAPPTQFAAR